MENEESINESVDIHESLDSIKTMLSVSTSNTNSQSQSQSVNHEYPDLLPIYWDFQMQTKLMWTSMPYWYIFCLGLEKETSNNLPL